MKISKLLILTCVYLIVPNLLFLYFWFDLEFAILSICFFLGGIILLYPKLDNDFLSQKIEIKYLSYCLVLSVFFVIFSGTGDLSPQVYDFWAHNAKLNNLLDSEWPLIIKENNTFLAYYFGYYITPSGIAYLTGISLKLMNFISITFGLVLAFIWTLLYFKKNIKKLLIATLISTPSIYFLNLVSSGFYSKMVFLENKMWLHDFFKALQWEPNQLIPSIIAASLVLNEFSKSNKIVYCILLIPIFLTWSPFLSISFSLIILINYLWIFLIKKDFSIFNNRRFLIGLFLITLAVIPIAVFFNSNLTATKFIFMPAYHEKNWSLSFLLFCFFNIFIFYFFSYQKNSTWNNKIFISSFFISIFLCATIRIGVYNDFLIKTSIFPILIIHFCFAEQFYESFQKGKKNLLISIVFLWSITGTLSNFLNQFTFLKIKDKATIYHLNKIKNFNKYNSIDKALIEKYSHKEALQYRGSMQSIYAKYLAKKTLEKKLNPVKKSHH